MTTAKSYIKVLFGVNLSNGFFMDLYPDLERVLLRVCTVPLTMYLAFTPYFPLKLPLYICLNPHLFFFLLRYFHYILPNN